MVEMAFNQAWIRLRQSHSRALRFAAFHPLERLKISQSLERVLPEDEYKQASRQLAQQCRDVRHLFRFRDRNGQMRWANSWASVPSFEARMMEVKRAEVEAPDRLMYAFYSWTSSAIHGGPQSVDEMFDGSSGDLRVRSQPEANPAAQFAMAAAILHDTWATPALIRLLS